MFFLLFGRGFKKPSNPEFTFRMSFDHKLGAIQRGLYCSTSSSNGSSICNLLIVAFPDFWLPIMAEAEADEDMLNLDDKSSLNKTKV